MIMDRCGLMGLLRGFSIEEGGRKARLAGLARAGCSRRNLAFGGGVRCGRCGGTSAAAVFAIERIADLKD